MREINFFVHLQPNIRISRKKLVFNILVFIFFSFLLIYAVFSFFEIRNLEKEVTVLSNNLISLESVQRISIINQKRELDTSTELTYLAFRKHYEKISEKNIINYDLLKLLMKSRPQDIFFENIKIDSNTININAIAISKFAIAEFENRLNHAENLHIDSISNITMDLGQYSFSIVISIGEVHTDETN